MSALDCDTHESKGKCKIEKRERYGKFANKQKIAQKTKGSVYENYIRSAMLY